MKKMMTVVPRAIAAKVNAAARMVTSAPPTAKAEAGRITKMMIAVLRGRVAKGSEAGRKVKGVSPATEAVRITKTVVAPRGPAAKAGTVQTM